METIVVESDQEEADRHWMEVAIGLAATVRSSTSPNPWVGAVVVTAEGRSYRGSTRPPGGNHAEIEALSSAGADARGSTMYVTLEPCAHQGRTGPCVEAIVAAGVARVVVGIEDPDPRVAGQGLDQLRQAGVNVDVGLLGDQVAEQLSPYVHQRRTGRPYVVLKLAASLDGRTAAPDGTSQWITGEAARADSHRLRAESDVVIVGAGTVRADDPSLTVRHVDGPDPRRIVLGEVPDGAAVLPAESHTGALEPLLDRLGAEGALQVMVEGGAGVAGQFHRNGLIDRYVIYLAPVLFGGDGARSMFAGEGASTMAEVWRGRIVGVVSLGDDLRIDVVPDGAGS